jgi:hypothetical protein
MREPRPDLRRIDPHEQAQLAADLIEEVEASDQ